MDLEGEAKKEVERVDKIISNLEIIDEKASELVKVLNSYHKDCRGFFEQKKFLQALETAFICWAYVDAGLHLGVFKVPEEMMETFTV